MITNYCANFNSKISFPVPLPVRKLCRTSWRQKLSLRRVSMIASTNFRRYFNRPTPLVSMFHLGIRTRIIHPIPLGIYPCCHMNWVISTSFNHRYSLGDGLHPLHQVRLQYPFLEMFRAEVSVPY